MVASVTSHVFCLAIDTMYLFMIPGLKVFFNVMVATLLQVPVTDFFGSVMRIKHTKAAYAGFTGDPSWASHSSSPQNSENFLEEATAKTLTSGVLDKKVLPLPWSLMARALLLLGRRIGFGLLCFLLWVDRSANVNEFKHAQI